MRKACATALALGLSAGPSHGAAADQLCQAMAARVRALPAAGKGAEGALGPIGRLAAQSPPFVGLDTTKSIDLSGGVAPLHARLQSQYRAPASVLAAIDAIVEPSSNQVWLRRMGASSVYAVEQQAGTMDCSDFVFFNAPAGRPASLIARPPQYQAKFDSGEEPASFCVADRGLVGQVGGASAFIEETWAITDPDYDIVVSTWGQAGWSSPCEIQISYQPVYEVSEIHCQGPVCRALPAAAEAMAAGRQLQIKASGSNATPDFAWGPKPSPAQQATFAQIEALIEQQGDDKVPTLGAKGAMDESFGDDKTVFPVELDGRTYAAVLGHRSIGWRVFPDYLLGLYDAKNGALEPIAGLEIQQSQGPLVLLKTQPWPTPKPAG